MTPASASKLPGSAALALLAACGSEPMRSITTTLTANHTSNFSAWSEPVSLGPVINMSGFNDQRRRSPRTV